MGEYTSYDYAAMVAAVSVLLVSKCIIIITTNLVVKSFDFLINQDCSQYLTEEEAANSEIEGIVGAVQEVLSNGEKMPTPVDTILELTTRLKLTEESCTNIYKPFLQGLLVWDIMICILWLFAIFMIIGIITKTGCAIVPFLIWLPLTVMFATAGVIAFVVKANLTTNFRGIILVCTIIFLILQLYYCVVTYMQLQATSKVNRSTAPSTQMISMKGGFNNYDKNY